MFFTPQTLDLTLKRIKLLAFPWNVHTFQARMMRHSYVTRLWAMSWMCQDLKGWRYLYEAFQQWKHHGDASYVCTSNILLLIDDHQKAVTVIAHKHSISASTITTGALLHDVLYEARSSCACIDRVCNRHPRSLRLWYGATLQQALRSVNA